MRAPAVPQVHCLWNHVSITGETIQVSLCSVQHSFNLWEDFNFFFYIKSWETQKKSFLAGTPESTERKTEQREGGHTGICQVRLWDMPVAPGVRLEAGLAPPGERGAYPAFPRCAQVSLPSLWAWSGAAVLMVCLGLQDPTGSLQLWFLWMQRSKVDCDLCSD